LRSVKAFAVAGVALCIVFISGSAWAQRGHARSLTVHPAVGTQAVDVFVQGDLRCRDVTGMRCRGYLYGHPIELFVTSRAHVEIEVTWANVNTVMALVGPSGSYADNDGGRGELSRLEMVLERGRHTLYLGTRHPGRFGQARVAVTARPLAPPPPRVVVVSPPRPVPPRVVVAPAPPRPRVVPVVVYDRHDEHGRGRHGRRGR
jgi:hypothetical protein